MRILIANMMKAGAWTVLLIGGTTFAGPFPPYPVAPPTDSINLQLGNFIQYVPEQSPWLEQWPWGTTVNPVIGDNIGQHPGGYISGGPPQGVYFVGVWDYVPEVYTKFGAGVYLWETTGGGGLGSNDIPFDGPQVQLGFWDGLGFLPVGNPHSASYQGTHVASDIAPTFEICFSFIPFSDFGITDIGDLHFPIAARVEAAYPNAHNQVTAVALVDVPEPTGARLVLCVAALASGYALHRRKHILHKNLATVVRS